MKDIAAIAFSGKWNRRFYGDFIYVNSDKIEITNRLEFSKEFIRLKTAKLGAKMLFVLLSKKYKLDLPKLAESDKECRSVYQSFIDGNFESLFVFFSKYAGVKNEEDFFFGDEMESLYI